MSPGRAGPWASWSSAGSPGSSRMTAQTAPEGLVGWCKDDKIEETCRDTRDKISHECALPRISVSPSECVRQRQ